MLAIGSAWRYDKRRIAAELASGGRVRISGLLSKVPLRLGLVPISCWGAIKAEFREW